MMNAKILLVDDEHDVREPLKFNLEKEGYTVTTAENAAQALACLKNAPPDLILLDVMLPDISGTKLANQLKNNLATASIPIIMLTGKDKETDIVVGLSMGADDYVTKPFSTTILVARIESQLRRIVTNQHENDAIIEGPLKIVPATQQVFVDSASVELTMAEFKILSALVRAHGDILSREKLMGEFGSDPSVTERTIDVHIAAMRKKLGDARTLIKTVHRLGYRFEL
ncbi:MAG: response regulator transcription factor [Sedimentisphaerales bacterium]|nr:response regulator transcription factor [Sedimentisphaerales bacterium]